MTATKPKPIDHLIVKRPRMPHKPPEPDQDVCVGCYDSRGWLTDLGASAVVFAHICPHCRKRWIEEN
jgi:hypothetical protein